MYESLILGGAAALAGGAYYQYLKNRTPEGGCRIVSGRVLLPQEDRPGRTSLVCIGTYGVRQGYRIIEAFTRANCLHDIGAILLIELNEKHVKEFLAQIPPALKSRVVVCNSEILTAGFGNKTVQEVDSLRLRKLWVPEVMRALREFAALIRHTDTPYIEDHLQTFTPSLLWLLVSPGGHLVVSADVAKFLKEEFGLADIYALTVLPEDGHLRAEMPEGLAKHDDIKAVRLWLVQDNRLDKDKLDRASAKLLASMYQSHQLLGHHLEPYNMLSNLQPTSLGPNGVAIFRHWERRNVPVFITRLPPTTFWTTYGECYMAGLEGIETLTEGSSRSAALGSHEGRSSCFTAVNIPLYRESLVEVKAGVEAALKEIAWANANRSRHLLFASHGPAMTRRTRTMSVSVTQIETVKNGWEELKKLARTGNEAVTAGGAEVTSTNTPLPNGKSSEDSLTSESTKILATPAGD